jgi:hypothetical protein
LGLVWSYVLIEGVTGVLWETGDLDTRVRVITMNDEIVFELANADRDIVVLDNTEDDGVADGVCETASASMARHASSTMFKVDWTNDSEHELTAQVCDVERKGLQPQAPSRGQPTIICTHEHSLHLKSRILQLHNEKADVTHVCYGKGQPALCSSSWFITYRTNWQLAQLLHPVLCFNLLDGKC